MANVEESNPLLGNPEVEEKKSTTSKSSSTSGTAAETVKQQPAAADSAKQQPGQSGVSAATPVAMGWTAEGMPMQGTAMGEPMMRRSMWDSSICSCLGRNDEFFSSDIEVCFLGSVAPCVLYGSNAERLGSSSGTFANHCLPYTGLYVIGNSLFGWNCMAPWFSYPSRTAMRQKFNLEGSCEALTRSGGCYESFLEDEVQREQCESACDLATHVFCHPCALCQEGRELRRRLPHPGFNAQPVLLMLPPSEQAMGRGA